MRTDSADAVLHDLPGRGTIALTGKDRVAFLQGLVTNDVRKLAAGEGCHAAFLTPKGKMLADLIVLAGENELVVDTEPELATKLEQLFRKYLVFQEVGIESATAATHVRHLAGPGAAPLLVSLGAALPPEGPWRHAIASVSGLEVRLVRAGRTGIAGFDLRVSAHACASLDEAFLGAGARRGSAEELENARIEAGLPRWGFELDENVLPNEAWLERDAISYAKGCYIGQETVARIRTYGHVNRKLALLRLAPGTLVARGAEVRQAGGRVGVVTSATPSSRPGPVVALGYVRRELAEPGTAVEVDSAQGPVPAEVAPLPPLPA